MKRVSFEELNTRIKNRFPEEEFEIVKYETLGKPGEIKCLSCGDIIKINKFSNFFAKNKRYGCKNCHGYWRDREVKINKIKELYDIINVEVKNTHAYYTVKCKKCGHIRRSSLNNLVKSLKCGCQTSVYRNRTPQQFINECNRYYNNQLELVGEYVNQTTKVLLRHIPCGMIWKVRPSDIIHGRSHCPKCRTQESLGARKIKIFLEKNNIIFEQEKLLENSRQRFDFYLPDFNLAIEYNGRQHYVFNSFFHKNEEGFLQYQERDKRKQKYCKDKNIKLLIISYLDDNNIEKILSKNLNKFND